MFVAKVIGHVVATKKEETLHGRRLVMLRPLLVDPADPSKFKDGSNTIVAVDTMGAGTGEVVLFVQGSSARQVTGLKGVPVDASVIGIVDSVNILGASTYQSGSN
jgi:ethanolamine utilization protein EutN